jgi:hypothetical protein
VRRHHDVNDAHTAQQYRYDTTASPSEPAPAYL